MIASVAHVQTSRLFSFVEQERERERESPRKLIRLRASKGSLRGESFPSLPPPTFSPFFFVFVPAWLTDRQAKRKELKKTESTIHR